MTDDLKNLGPMLMLRKHQMMIAAFAEESNKIEGIDGASQKECDALDTFVTRPFITIDNLIEYVQEIQPDAVLRLGSMHNVRVGNHIPPPGGPAIGYMLQGILDKAEKSEALNPQHIHVEYEMLHPFTDGNGRSGRALWLWMMLKQNQNVDLGFLHTFYYQTLAAGQT